MWKKARAVVAVGAVYTTFNNDILKTIQIWLIESLLEQAVGRARLLRFDCTVKVFAGFPVEQAELIKQLVNF